MMNCVAALFYDRGDSGCSCGFSYAARDLVSGMCVRRGSL